MDGVIIVNKTKGMTSFDVVRLVKKALNMKKVGHTGTLDPMAEGVLPVCFGKATKFAELIMSEEKIYEAKMKLGAVTDTYDAEGEIVEECAWEHIDEESVRGVVESFAKSYEQMPPIYSAIKVNGKRLYEYARKGESVEIKGRNVTIHKIEDIKVELPYVSFRVICSKGTYIRSLCYDIGRALNSGAYMTALTRVKSGSFHIDDSVRADELSLQKIEEKVQSIEGIFGDLDELKLDERFSKLVSNGVVISDRRLVANLKVDKSYRVYTHDDTFLGLGSLTDKGFKIHKRYN